MAQITYNDLIQGILQDVSSSALIKEEINTISKEVKSLLSHETKAVAFRQSSSFFVRLNGVIAMLEGMSQKYTIDQGRRYFSGKGFKDKKHDEIDAEKVSEYVAKAKQALEDAKVDLELLQDNNQLKAALMEGYIIVTQLREQLLETIDYKVLAVGRGADGSPVLFESHPTLQELLSAANFDGSSFTLRVNLSCNQFQNLLAQIDQQSKKNVFKHSILNKMSQVQLNSDQASMLENLLNISLALSDVKGAGMNKGQAIESFEEYFLNDGGNRSSDVDYIYSLLEKGRNNLAYYKGPDIRSASGLFQVKTLSVYGDKDKEGSSGRFNAVVLSSVLQPLIMIRDELSAMKGVLDSSTLTSKIFLEKEGEGDHLFEEKVGRVVKNVIKQEIGAK